MPGFGVKELEQIVQLAGLELEREDRLIAGSFATNSVYHGHGSDLVPGICYLKNERYYQRVVARALLPAFPYRVHLEDPRRGAYIDFALYSGGSTDAVALGEMKLWMGTGESDINKIRDDMNKLANEPCGQFLVVLAISHRGKTDQDVQDLLKKLGCPDKPKSLYRFGTKFFPGGNSPITDGEFAVLGVRLKEEGAAA
jgi:hypothetical protein